MHTEKGRIALGCICIGAKGFYPCAVKSAFQSDQTAADLFLGGGTHRSTVFFPDPENRKHESGFYGNDPDYAAVFLSRHVREGRYAVRSAVAALH